MFSPLAEADHSARIFSAVPVSEWKMPLPRKVPTGTVTVGVPSDPASLPGVAGISSYAGSMPTSAEGVGVGVGVAFGGAAVWIGRAV